MDGFTPGPWEAAVFALYAGREKLAHFGPIRGMMTCDSTRQSEANAKLCAAAPALHSAVEALVECFIKRGPFDEPLGSSEQAPSINAGIAALKQARSNPTPTVETRMKR